MKSFLSWFGRADFNRAARALFYFLLILLPFGRRKILVQYTGGFDEYETIFLYLSDIVLVLCLVFSFKDIWRFAQAHSREAWFWSLAIFLVAALISVGLASYQGLALFDFLRLAAVTLLALGVGAGLRSGWLQFRHFFLILVLVGVFEAALGFSQFARQHSVGLQVLGEPYLPGFTASITAARAPVPAGIAKIDIDGGKLTRGYGTFPHPNVLSAFLLLSLASLFYFWLRNGFPWGLWWRHGFTDIRRKDFYIYTLREILIAIGIFIVALGLLFAFSRTAWLIAILLALTFSIFGFLIQAYRRQAVKLFFISLTTIFLLLGAFGVFIFPRAQVSLGEPAVTYRLRYDEVALSIVKNQPLGVGIGNQVIYSVQNNIYRQFGMTQLWEWQPIHNIYLLMASEIGVPGVLAFIIFILALFVKINWRNLVERESEGLVDFVSVAMLATLLFFGLVDHFLWTLEPGRLMLWIAIGILMGLGTSKIGQMNKPS